MAQSGYIWMGSSGCLLPFLIIFNLFFGKIIFGSVGLWLGVEALLILIFTLKIRQMVTGISRQFKPADFSRNGMPDKIIDIQGQEVKDDPKLR